MKVTKTMIKNALWLSRHQPTSQQLAEISSKGFSVVAGAHGLGEMILADEDDQVVFSESLAGIIEEHEIAAIFGVFAAPVLELMAHRADQAVSEGKWDNAVHCWSAWNVQRAKEGEKPTFEHLRFCWVGAI